MSGPFRAYKPITGHHCESSAMVNALTSSGYSITEEQIIGAGAAPGFVYEKSTFPFLGGRSHEMRKCFSKTTNIPYEINEQMEERHWSDIEKLVNSGTPVVLRVDMRFLPYLFLGKVGPRYMSFGWHYITLYEIDIKDKTAKVSDTTHSELQSIKLSALEKARFSKTKVYPPQGEYYYFHKADDSFSFDWNEISQLSLKQYFRNMGEESTQENQLTGLGGLKLLSREISDLSKSVPSYLIEAVLGFHYGCIETNGTGGAAFRTLYYHFLENHLYSDNRGPLLSAAKECEQRWHSLADAYKEGAGTYRKGTRERKKEILLAISERAKKVFDAEYEMNRQIKETFDL